MNNSIIYITRWVLTAFVVVISILLWRNGAEESVLVMLVILSTGGQTELWDAINKIREKI